MGAGDAVTVSAFVDVEPAFAFEVFTSDVDAWWRKGPQYRPGRKRSGVMQLEPRLGGRLLEMYDESSQDYFEIGRVRVWEPPKRLIFSWMATNFAPGQSTEVEVRFEPDAGGTRVTLEHRHWHTLPLDHPARHGLQGRHFDAMIGKWWADLLLTLRSVAKEAAARRAH